MTDRIAALPFYVHPTPDGVILKRGTVEVSILGPGAAAFVETVLAATANGATREQIRERFPVPDRAAVAPLLDQLLASRLFVTTGVGGSEETPLDVFHWQFAADTREVTERIDRANVVLVGLNGITRQLLQSFRAAGLRPPVVLDDPRLRNVRLYGSADPAWAALRSEAVDAASWEHPGPACVVATSELGDQRALLDWNGRCVERGHHYLPVLLQNFVGYVGPLVVPGETACFDCLRARWNAHLDGSDARGAIDELAVDAQQVIGFHPAMSSMLGDLAAFELTKVYGGALPHRRIGVQIEVGLLVPRLTTRRVLKVPRCPTCSPLRARPGVSAWVRR